MKQYFILTFFILSVFCLFGQEQEDRMIFGVASPRANVLSIYQILYNDVHPTRFIYNEEILDSLNSTFFKDIYAIFAVLAKLFQHRVCCKTKQQPMLLQLG